MTNEHYSLDSFDNMLITDELGNIVFYDLSDMNILEQMDIKPDDFFHPNFLENYVTIDEQTSSIYQVLKYKKPIHLQKQRLQTKVGFTFYSSNSTYPIFNGERCIGAVEFSKHTFKKGNINTISQHTIHKIDRYNDSSYCFNDIIGNSELIQKQVVRAKNIAQTNSAVMIYGASGTGKEMFAQSIHNESSRCAKPYRVLNCGMLTDENIDYTIFGNSMKQGILMEANEGTLLLDNIHLLEKPLQSRLLYALELRELIMDDQCVPLNIRYISTTNKQPDDLLANEQLEASFYYRLNVVQIDLPNLCERKEDILPIVENYIDFFNNKMPKHFEHINDEVKQLFLSYNWPGNVRELKNAIEHAYNEPHHGIITREQIPYRIKQSTENEQATIEYHGTLKDLTEQHEKLIIVEKLRNTNGKLAETARQLGISRQLLKYKCTKYGIL